MDPPSPGVVIGLFIIAAEAFATLITFLFIMSAILCDFHKKKTLSTNYKIQVPLKVSSMIFTIGVTCNEFVNISQRDPSRPSHFSPPFTVVLVYCMCSCSWLVALQCFFYFIKIVHFKGFSNPWVKMRISSIVPWQIVAVEVISLGFGLLNLLPYRRTNDSSAASSCISDKDIVVDYLSLFLLIIIGAPLVLSTITISLTSIFLRCHMQKTSGEVQQYERALHTLLRFLFLYSLFYILMFFYYFTCFPLSSIGYWINLILVLSFIPGLYLLQILENPHWRTTWKEITCNP